MSKSEEVCDIGELEDIDDKKEYNKLSNEEKTLKMHSKIENVNIKSMFIRASDELVSRTYELDNDTCINHSSSG